jgi:hypothetical protein
MCHKTEQEPRLKAEIMYMPVIILGRSKYAFVPLYLFHLPQNVDRGGESDGTVWELI